VAVVVNLESVIEAMELPREWRSYLDPETGEIIWISEEEGFFTDQEEDAWDDLPEWQQESLAHIRRVLDSGRAIACPTRMRSTNGS
jgi:hypothetical protein